MHEVQNKKKENDEKLLLFFHIFYVFRGCIRSPKPEIRRPYQILFTIGAAYTNNVVHAYNVI